MFQGSRRFRKIESLPCEDNVFIVMTNEKRELLSSPEEVPESRLKELNQELRNKKSMNRYVPCSQAGKMDNREHSRIFLGILVGSKHIKRELTPNYFIIVKNEINNTGHAYYEAMNKSAAIDIIKKKLGREIIIINGKKLSFELNITE